MEKAYSKKNENKWQKFWENEGVYNFDPESGKPVYSIDTPPPYVSAAHLHVGHAMSYSQADFIVRFWRMKGFNIFYPMGFDDNGLPTERYVEKKYNINKAKITKEEFVKLCIKETELGGETYKTLWKALGLSIDWSLLYNTIGNLAQKVSQRSFIDLYKKGKIERRQGPVIWCVQCQTALAQADLEDAEEKSNLIYIKFDIKGGGEITIATTRPELMPACVAIFVHPEDKRYKDLAGKEAILPFFERTVKIYANKAVDKEFGTGAVYHCTFGDLDDVAWVYEFKLPTIEILEKNGVLNDKAGKYKGVHIKKMRDLIVADLEKENRVIKKEPLVHSVNVHERCKVPAEILVSPQWFIRVLDIKKEMLAAGEKIKWHPEFMKTKYDDWVKGLKFDWCISRQRYFGVPFPVWHCADCNEIILPEDSDLPVDPSYQAPKIKKCPNCKSANIVGEKDVMDTWMTSSVTPLINARWGEKDNLMDKIYPMSVRVQGFEIIRTWLFYTAVKSFYHTESLPWENVMISGWGLDGKGKKMSKSLGNFTEVEPVIEKYSADALRYWAAGSNLGSNLRYIESEVKDGDKVAAKLWNATRLVSDFIEKFDYKNFKGEIMPADKWILAKLQKATGRATKEYESYEYANAKRIIEEFFWKDFCDYYLEMVKYRIYEQESAGDASVRSAKFTLAKTILAILKLWAPILPYVTEEIYQAVFKDIEGAKSIHISSWPAIEKNLIDEETEKAGEIAKEIIGRVRKYKADNKMSVKKEIDSVIIETDKAIEEKLKDFLIDLEKVNNAKEVKFGKGNDAVSKNVKIAIG